MQVFCEMNYRKNTKFYIIKYVKVCVCLWVLSFNVFDKWLIKPNIWNLSGDNSQRIFSP